MAFISVRGCGCNIDAVEKYLTWDESGQGGYGRD
jgi:hypothetical protein